MGLEGYWLKGRIGKEGGDVVWIAVESVGVDVEWEMVC
jgi:hypothetical protein